MIIKDFELISKTNVENFKEYVESLSSLTNTVNYYLIIKTVDSNTIDINSKISTRTRNAIIFLSFCKKGAWAQNLCFDLMILKMILFV